MDPATGGRERPGSHADRAPLKVGVVGCGLIAQVMHLPYLAQMSDRFELAAVCDLSPTRARGCAERYGARTAHQRWEEMISEPLDAVLVATTGDHAPVAIAAAEAGLHVFVEKSMALCSRDGERMVAAAGRAGVTLMVGTMKRYDPAYERLVELLPSISDLRLVGVTTLEAPIAPYVAHLPLIRAADDISGELARPSSDPARAALDEAVGDADEQTRRVYRTVLLNTLVHELNMLGGLLGAPTGIRHAGVTRDEWTIELEFGESLPPDVGAAAGHHPIPAGAHLLRRRSSPPARFPSPFLRNAPTG